MAAGGDELIHPFGLDEEEGNCTVGPSAKATGPTLISHNHKMAGGDLRSLFASGPGIPVVPSQPLDPTTQEVLQPNCWYGPWVKSTGSTLHSHRMAASSVRLIHWMKHSEKGDAAVEGPLTGTLSSHNFDKAAGDLRSLLVTVSCCPSFSCGPQ